MGGGRRKGNQSTGDRRGPSLAIDLFSGAGGLSLGLRMAGFRVIAAIESDPLATETYRLNHAGTVVVMSDIREVRPRDLMERLGLREGELDLLAGCPPCQSFSVLQTLNRGRTVRNPEQKDLLFEICRFARVFRPKAIMMENVPGLADDRRMTAFRRRLKRLGYIGQSAILNAANYGVPQRRNRLIYLASRSGKMQWPPTTSTAVTVHEAIGSLPRPGKTGDPLHDIRENRSEHVKALIRLVPRNGGSRSALHPSRQLGCHKRCDGFYDVYGRLAWDKIAPTITSGFVNPSKGRFLHPTQNRAITPREAALLQTFPPDYRFSLRRGKYAVAAMIGNALPPEFIRRLARPIRRHVARLEVRKRG